MKKKEFVKPKSEEEAPQIGQSLKPGDNPNKMKAVRRKPENGPKNSTVSTRPVLESVDPVPPSVSSVEVNDITDSRCPGSFHVGKIFLRINAFSEVNSLVSSMVDSTQGLVFQRVQLPATHAMAGFITSYCLAYQMFTTLTLNSTSGPFRKLKVLRMAGISVPDFLPPLVQCFGNYTTSEGLMKVAAIEQLIPFCIEQAFENYMRLPGVRPLPGYQPLAPIGVYESSNFKQDFIDLTKMMHPEIFGPKRIIVAAAVSVDVDINMETCVPADTIQLLTRANLFDIPDVELRKMCAFLRLRDIDYATLGNDRYIADFTQLDMIHGSRRAIEQLSEWLNIAIPEYIRVCYRALETMFTCSPFAPANGGNSAQCVIGGPEATIDSANATHSYSLSPSSAAIGFILMPATSVEYNPEYILYSGRTRYQHLMKIADKFVQKSLKG